jgi:hypothetical protein
MILRGECLVVDGGLCRLEGCHWCGGVLVNVKPLPSHKIAQTRRAKDARGGYLLLEKIPRLYGAKRLSSEHLPRGTICFRS